MSWWECPIGSVPIQRSIERPTAWAWPEQSWLTMESLRQRHSANGIDGSEEEMTASSQRSLSDGVSELTRLELAQSPYATEKTGMGWRFGGKTDG